MGRLELRLNALPALSAKHVLRDLLLPVLLELSALLHELLSLGLRVLLELTALYVLLSLGLRVPQVLLS